MSRFFCAPGDFAPSGLWSVGHLALFLCSVTAILLALLLSRRFGEHEIRRAVRVLVILLWVLELGKILFVLLRVGSRDPDDFLPLYYCSLVLYAGAFSAFFKGRARFFGDCFLATASLVGGAVFLIFPTSTLPQSPAWHVMSLHSFLLHSAMVYLGLLLLFRGVYRPVVGDIVYPAALIGTCCALALLFNYAYERLTQGATANLMFLAAPAAGTPLVTIYRLTGVFFTPLMCVGQMLGPFLLVWLAWQGFAHLKKK